ncbi:MAG: helix-turn-helix domain-containing protein [Rhodobacteraceae bacterium]|nr:helix-turn-helix domain-containing protein [Paracoccaceae bacterium]
MDRPQHVLFAFVGEFTHLAFSNAIEPLRLANRLTERDLYTWTFASRDGAPVVASNGARMMVDTCYADLPKFDLLFLITGNDVREHIDRQLLAFLRKARVSGAQMATFCSGAFAFAAAGFLDDQDAALHWEFHVPFREAYPKVHLASGVYVRDGTVMTAAGGHASADLVLDLLRREHGQELATSVSDQMLYNSVRTEASLQRISIQARYGVRSDKLARAISAIEEKPDEIKSVAEICQYAGISSRQLERLFKRYLNTTPKKHLLGIRLAKARQLLQQTEMSVTEITLACGFENTSHFARLYRRSFGISPREQRAM